MQRGEAVGGAGCTSSLLPTSPLPSLCHHPTLSLPVGREECGAEQSESRSCLSPLSATAGTSEGAPAERLAVQTPLMPTCLPLQERATLAQTHLRFQKLPLSSKHSLDGDETTS